MRPSGRISSERNHTQESVVDIGGPRDGSELRIIEPSLKFTGTQMNYYFICKRKLWLFSRGLEMEEMSDLVLLGKLLHERGYARRRKEVQVGRVKIDFVGSGCEIHEVKRSRKA